MPSETFEIAESLVELLSPEEPAPVGASGPPLEANLDHVDQALNARLEDYRGLPRFEELLRILAEQVQEIEDALWEIAQDDVDSAVGTQLDGFGAIVGAERQGLTDPNYRALIRATIRANRSEGTTPDLYSIVTAATGSTAAGQARLEFYPPAGFILEILTPPAFDSEILHGLLVRGTAAGVRGITVVSEAAPDTRLRFSRASDFPTFRVASGFDGAAGGAGDAGELVRALDERTA